MQTASNDAVASQNATLNDGSMLMAGRFVNTLTGATDARGSLFEVQSSAVWQQYSEIDASSGNSYFAKLASQTGMVAPRLPMDSGQVALAAGAALQPDATLLSAPALGGRSGSVEIASSDIEILEPGSTAAPGYVAISSAN